MIQEMVFGSKLEKEAQKFSETIPSLRKAIAEAVATMWSQEVLLDGGFTTLICIREFLGASDRSRDPREYFRFWDGRVYRGLCRIRFYFWRSVLIPTIQKW